MLATDDEMMRYLRSVQDEVDVALGRADRPSLPGNATPWGISRHQARVRVSLAIEDRAKNLFTVAGDCSC